MHLINDVYLILPLLWRKAHLLGQRTHIIYAIVGGSIELNDIKGSIFIEGFAGATAVASLKIGTAVFAVERFGQDAGTSRFTHAARAGEQKGMGDMVGGKRIFQRTSDVLLPHHVFKTLGPIFAGGNDEVAHLSQK